MVRGAKRADPVAVWPASPRRRWQEAKEKALNGCSGLFLSPCCRMELSGNRAILKHRPGITPPACAGTALPEPGAAVQEGEEQRSRKKAALPVRSVFPEGFSHCVYSTTVNRTGLRGGTRAYWTEGCPSMSPAQILRPSGTGMPRSTPLPAAAITKPLQQVPMP